MTFHGVLFVMFLLIHIVQIAATDHKSSYNTLFLVKSLGSGDKDPLVLVIKPDSGTEPATDVYHFLLAREDEKGSLSDGEEIDESREDAKDLFYNYLRSSPYDTHEKTQNKRTLREALRARCMVIIGCVNECPPRKPKCPKKCQKKYDKEEICKLKRGRTMPPAWLLRK